jgi:hypothetical protein
MKPLAKFQNVTLEISTCRFKSLFESKKKKKQNCQHQTEEQSARLIIPNFNNCYKAMMKKADDIGERSNKYMEGLV